MCRKSLGDEHCCAFVRRLFDDLLHSANTAFCKAMVVFHRTIRELDGTHANVHSVAEVHVLVVVK